MQLLLNNGADVNAQGGGFGNALQAASVNGNLEVVQLLVDEGADVKTQGGIYGNALQAASFNGRLEVVQLLVDEGADVNAQGGIYGNALLAASDQDHINVIKLLLRFTTETDDLGRTALFWASRNGRLPMVQYLLSIRRFDPDTKNYYGSTALSAAIANGHCEIAELLIASSASTQEQFHVGRSLLWWAFRAGNPQIIRLISQHAESCEAVPQKGDLLADAVFDATSDWCDACTLSILDSSVSYSCQECIGFCLCSDCYKRGFRCRGQAHALTTSLDENS
jgi:ankyrin repeat protein